MNDTAQVIIAIATLVTSLGTIILGLVNRQTINTVKTQTDGMIAALKVDAKEHGRAEGKIEEMQHQLDQHAREPVKVDIVKVPTLGG